MIALRIQTPVSGFTGEVVGVNFVDGFGETEDENAIAYFTRQGFGLDGSARQGFGLDGSAPEGTEPEPEAEAKAKK